MRVLLFAQIKDALGTAELDLPIANGQAVASLWQTLITAQPKLAAFQSSTRLARNGEYADQATIFCNTDEVALIPPVSGG
jgi:molybdopterin converting factor subunit 1